MKIPRLSRRSSTEAPQRQLVGGALVSPLDAVQLPEQFEAAQAQATMIVARYVAGEVDAHQAAEQLQGCVVTQPNGSRWTVGATTGRWYQWIPATEMWAPALPPAAHDLSLELDDDFELHTTTSPVSPGVDPTGFAPPTPDTEVAVFAPPAWYEAPAATPDSDGDTACDTTSDTTGDSDAGWWSSPTLDNDDTGAGDLDGGPVADDAGLFGTSATSGETGWPDALEAFATAPDPAAPAPRHTQEPEPTSPDAGDNDDLFAWLKDMQTRPPTPTDL